MTSQNRLAAGIVARICGLAILSVVAVPAFGQTLDHFTFSTIASPRQAYVPFRNIITARSSSGALVSSFTGTVQLTANSGGTPLAVEAQSALQFTSGQWVGNVSVNEPGTNVSLLVLHPGTGRTGTSTVFQVESATFRPFNLPVLSLVSDRTRGVLYASVGPVAGPVGTIHVIDPVSGAILNSRSIGGGVGRIEMSPDATKLYVVTDDEKTVRRLHLPDFVEEVSLDLGLSEPGIFNRADDLAVHPTNPNTVAITKSRREISPRFTGVSVFEGTVEKTKAGNFVYEVNAVAWGAQSNRLYGLNNETTPAEFVQYEVTTTNITGVASRRNILSPFNGQIEFIGGRLYCTTGRIIDPEAFTIFSELANGHSDALMLALPDRKRVIYFTPGSLGFMQTYDTETWQLLASDPFPTPRGAGSGVAFWGTNGVAFHDGQRLYLAQNPWVPSGATADVRVTAVTSQGAALGTGVVQQVQATVQNLGPNNAGAVMIRVTAPADGVLVDGNLVGMSADKKISSREMTLRLASLPAGGSVDVQFTASSSVEGWEPFSVVAAGTGLDPNSSNNAAMIVLKAAPALSLASPVSFKFANTASASDRSRGTVLVASSSPLAPWGSSVVTVNPTNDEVSQPVLVGPRPSKLAVSDDGKYLYVGFQGVPEVRRFLLPGLTHDLTIPLGADGWTGPMFAGQMEVRPGHSKDIAVTRSAGSSMSFGFFRNGVEVLPDRSTPELVHFAGPNRILAHEDGWGIFVFDLTETNLTWVALWTGVQEFGSDDFTHANGKMYFADGEIFDATTGAASGSFFMFGPFGPAPIVDRFNGRALLLQRPTTTNYVVVAFDLASHSQVASNMVKGALGSVSGLNSFTRWAGDGLAFSAPTGVILTKTSLLPIGPAQFGMERLGITNGTVTLRLTNLPPGQYIVERCSQLGATWNPVGSPFPETTTQVLIPGANAQEFYRLIRVE